MNVKMYFTFLVNILTGIIFSDARHSFDASLPPQRESLQEIFVLYHMHIFHDMCILMHIFNYTYRIKMIYLVRDDAFCWFLPYVLKFIHVNKCSLGWLILYHWSSVINDLLYVSNLLDSTITILVIVHICRQPSY